MIIMIFEDFDTQIIINEPGESKPGAHGVKHWLIPASFYLALPHNLLMQTGHEDYYDTDWKSFKTPKEKATQNQHMPIELPGSMQTYTYIKLMQLWSILQVPRKSVAKKNSSIRIVNNPSYPTLKENIPTGQVWIGFARSGSKEKPDLLYMTQHPETAAESFSYRSGSSSISQLATYQSWQWFYTDDWIRVIFFILFQVLARNKALDKFQFLNAEGKPILPYAKELLAHIEAGLPQEVTKTTGLAPLICQYALITSMKQNVQLSLPAISEPQEGSDSEEEEDDEDEGENTELDDKQLLARGFTQSHLTIFDAYDLGNQIFRTCVTKNYQSFCEILAKSPSVPDTLSAAFSKIEDTPLKSKAPKNCFKKFFVWYLEKNASLKQDQVIQETAEELGIKFESPDPVKDARAGSSR